MSTPLELTITADSREAAEALERIETIERRVGAGAVSAGADFDRLVNGIRNLDRGARDHARSVEHLARTYQQLRQAERASYLSATGAVDAGSTLIGLAAIVSMLMLLVAAWLLLSLPGAAVASVVILVVGIAVLRWSERSGQRREPEVERRLAQIGSEIAALENQIGYIDAKIGRAHHGRFLNPAHVDPASMLH